MPIIDQKTHEELLKRKVPQTVTLKPFLNLESEDLYTLPDKTIQSNLKYEQAFNMQPSVTLENGELFATTTQTLNEDNLDTVLLFSDVETAYPYTIDVDAIETIEDVKSILRNIEMGIKDEDTHKFPPHLIKLK